MFSPRFSKRIASRKIDEHPNPCPGLQDYPVSANRENQQDSCNHVVQSVWHYRKELTKRTTRVKAASHRFVGMLLNVRGTDDGIGSRVSMLVNRNLRFNRINSLLNFGDRCRKRPHRRFRVAAVEFTDFGDGDDTCFVLGSI